MSLDGYLAVTAIAGWTCALIAVPFIRAVAKENAHLRAYITKLTSKETRRLHSQDVPNADPYVVKAANL